MKIKTKIIAMTMLLGAFGLISGATFKVKAEDTNSTIKENVVTTSIMNTTILSQAYGYWEAQYFRIIGGDKKATLFPGSLPEDKYPVDVLD